MFARYFKALARAHASGRNHRASLPTARRLAVESLEDRSLLAVNVVPNVETASASGADDIAVWIHPSDTSKSTIIGAVKTSSHSLRVYDLAGRQLQSVATSNINNVDLRYNFPLAGQPTTLLTGSKRSNDSIAIYKVDSQTGLLQDIAARTISTGMSIYGAAMYVSPTTGKYYTFVTSESGQVQQWELFATPEGKVDARQVRGFSVGSQSEGLVADDVLGHLYVGEENIALWKYSAEPGGGNARTRVDSTGSGGHLAADVEGLSIYYSSSGAGYLLASSQGNNEFAVYRREGVNSYLGSFKLVAGGGIDAVTDTDGIDVTNFPLGSQFPRGAFVAQDNDQNFKLVQWNSINTALGGILSVDTTWDPRLVGAGPIPNQAPQVNAGADQSIGFGVAAVLDATVNDDGKPGPPASLSTTWTVVSGPGIVTFASSSLVDTTATFSALGSYVLRLTAGDGELSAVDEVAVQVSTLPQTVAFQDGVSAAGTYFGTRDTMLWADSQTTNSGAVSPLKVDGSPDRAALLAWDITSIPTGSVVQSVTIGLQITNSSSQSYPVYGLLRPWHEQQTTWQMASQGAAWSSAGASGAADRNPAQIGTLVARSKGQATIVLNAAGVVLAQSWVNNPAANYGIVIQRYSASDGIEYASREAASAETRPKLSVTFTSSASPLAALAFAAVSSQEPLAQPPTMAEGVDTASVAKTAGSREKETATPLISTGTRSAGSARGKAAPPATTASKSIEAFESDGPCSETPTAREAKRTA